MKNLKTIIITGGGRGIGRAVVEMFAENKWRVIFTYQSNQDAAKKLTDQLVANGCDVRAMKCDQSDAQQIVGFFETLDDLDIYPDAVINNAGITGPKRRLDEVSAKILTDVMMTNVVGVTLFCRETVKRMSVRHGGRGGSIINISSTATKLGSPNQWVDYAATKGAIDVLTKGLAHEVGAEGIRVNAVAPGYVLTDVDRVDEIMARFEKMKCEVPMNRIGATEEIANAIFWLTSDQANYITGAIIPVSGGR